MGYPLKLGGILFLLTAICVGILGAVNSVTRPFIERNELASEEKAMKQLIVEAESFITVLVEEEKKIEETVIKKVVAAKKDSKTVGYVLRVEPNGYGGIIKMLVGVDTEGKVKGISILEHSETPGFGANANRETFKGQFKERHTPLKLSKSSPKEDEIEAITGATITSTAVTDAVNTAAEYVKEHQAEWGDNSESAD